MENWQDISERKYFPTCLGRVQIQNEITVLQERIISRMDLSKSMSEGEIRDSIDEEILKEGKLACLNLETRATLRKEIYYAIRQLGILQELLDNPDITEIMVNGTDPIFVEKKGKLEQLSICFDSVEKLNHVIQQIAADCNRVINEAYNIKRF